MGQRSSGESCSRPWRLAVAVLIAAGVWCSPARATFTVQGGAADIQTLIDELRKCTCKVIGLSEDGRTLLLIQELPLERCPRASQTMRDLVNQMLSEAAVTNVNLARTPPGGPIIFDEFATRTLDLNDVEQVPEEAPSTSPNCGTRCQRLFHVLAEYEHAARTGAGFPPSHAEGLRAENEHRTQKGQSTTLAGAVGVAAAGGGLTARFTYSDGTVEEWDLDANWSITRVRCP